MQVIVKDKSNKIKIEGVKRLSNLGKVTGLMFHSKKKCPAMLFEFSKPTKMKIHSWFVFFRFAAIWTDKENNVLEKKVVGPFRIGIGPKKPFYKLIEIPLNNSYREEIENLFGKVTILR